MPILYGTCHKDLEQISSILSVELIFNIFYIYYCSRFRTISCHGCCSLLKHILPISELYSSFRRTDLTTGDNYIGWRQSRRLRTIDERGSQIARIFHLSPVSQTNCNPKSLFLTVFDLRSSIASTFSIATYPVCVLIQ